MHDKRWRGPQVLKKPRKSTHINTAWVFWHIRHGKRSSGHHVESLTINSQWVPQDTLILTSNYPWTGPTGVHCWHPVIQVWVLDWSFSSSFDLCHFGAEDKLGSYACSQGKSVFTAPQQSAFERLNIDGWWRTAFIGKARRENVFSGSISKNFKAFCPSVFK